MVFAFIQSLGMGLNLGHFSASKYKFIITLYNTAIVSLSAATSASYIFFIGYKSMPSPEFPFSASISALRILI